MLRTLLIENILHVEIVEIIIRNRHWFDKTTYANLVLSCLKAVTAPGYICHAAIHSRVAIQNSPQFNTGNTIIIADKRFTCSAGTG